MISFPNHSCPEEEGYFLWENSLGVELIKVCKIPEENVGAIRFPAYCAAVNLRNRNVTQLKGRFSDKLVFENDN